MGGYIDANLVSGEFVAYRARLHWIVFAPAFLGAAVLDLIGLFLISRGVLERGSGHWMILLGAALLLLGSGWMAISAIRWKATEITVTSRRVLIKTGVLSRHTTEVLLAKVESVSIEESLIGRALGFGMMTIHGTGGTPETFERIAHPHEFRRQVQIQIEALTGREVAPIR